jgi:FAD synthetase
MYRVLDVKKPRDRLLRYIVGLRKVISELRRRELPRDAMRVVEAAERYLEDSVYYYEKGDIETGLVTVSYAEGLIDALKYLGIIEISWPRPRETVVVAAGTFDIVHPGHVEFLKYASSFGNKLYVIVARDSSVRRLKGREPVLPERARLKLVSSIRYVYRAVLGDEKDFLKPLEEIKPDVVVLGPDQRFEEDELSRMLRERGVEARVTRMPRRVEGFSSSAILRRVIEMFCP